MHPAMRALTGGRSNTEKRLSKQEQAAMRKIRPAEKKSMKDFIELAWKEMLMLENEEKFKQRVMKSDGFRTCRASTVIKEKVKNLDSREYSRMRQTRPTFTREENNPYDLNAQVRHRIEERIKVREMLDKRLNKLKEMQDKDESAWLSKQVTMRELQAKGIIVCIGKK